VRIQTQSHSCGWFIENWRAIEESNDGHGWRFPVFPFAGVAGLTVDAGKWSKLNQENQENKPYADAVIRTISKWDGNEISQGVSSKFKAE
jgi:hypothetical protein